MEAYSLAVVLFQIPLTETSKVLGWEVESRREGARVRTGQGGVNTTLKVWVSWSKSRKA